MKNLSWPQAFVVGVALVVLAVLAMSHADLNAYLAAVGAVLLLLGLGSIQAIKEQTNGSTSELVKLLRDAMERLAVSTPPPPGEKPRDQSPQP